MTQLVITYKIPAGEYDPAPDHRLVIPRPADWITSNQRRHWRAKAELTAAWREATGWAVKAAKIPALGPSRVIAELHMMAKRRSRIDPGNYQDTAKPCIDALVSVGRIWPDDSSDWVTGPDMRMGDIVPADSEALVLLIWGRTCCAAACDLHGKKAP